MAWAILLDLEKHSLKAWTSIRGAKARPLPDSSNEGRR